MAVGDFHWSGILPGWRKTVRTENMPLDGDIMPPEGKPSVGWRSNRRTKDQPPDEGHKGPVVSAEQAVTRRSIYSGQGSCGSLFLLLAGRFGKGCLHLLLLFVTLF